MGLIHQHLLLKINYKEKFHQADCPKYMNEIFDFLVTDVLKMQIAIPTRSVLVEDPDNYGTTGAVNLTTSHASYHHFRDEGFMAIDVYSCRCYKVEDVLEYFYNWLGNERYISDIEYSVIDRVAFYADVFKK